MTTRSPLLSPRLAALQRTLAAPDGAALAAFWREVADLGTPLIEPIEGDPRHALLTFLWHGDAHTRNVAVVDGPGGGEPGENLMKRLRGTDIWYITYRVRTDLRSKYRLAPNDSLLPESDVTDWVARTVNWRTDPLNPRVFHSGGDPDNPEDRGWAVSMVELPDAPPTPYLAPLRGVPAGRVERHRLRSKLLRNERRIWVYTPPGYAPDGPPCDLLVLLDGQAALTAMPTPTILDNLLAEGRVPPFVAVLLDNIGGLTRLREYLCSEPFSAFLARELLPWVRRRYRVADDPGRVILGGQSAGGLAASFAALRHSDVFGAVLSQSGSYWWRPEGDDEHEWLARQYVASPRLPLRFYLDVGVLETVTTPGDGPTQLLANRHMRDVLQARGYPVTYAEFNGGHDFLAWRRTLADGLIALAGSNGATLSIVNEQPA